MNLEFSQLRSCFFFFFPVNVVCDSCDTQHHDQKRETKTSLLCFSLYLARKTSSDLLADEPANALAGGACQVSPDVHSFSEASDLNHKRGNNSQQQERQQQEQTNSQGHQQ